MSKLIDVLLPTPLDRTFTYVLDEDREYCIGQWVIVPFGNKEFIGLIWNETVIEGNSYIHQAISIGKIRNVKVVLKSLPHLKSTMHEFISWVARYNVAPLGAVFKMVLGLANKEMLKLAGKLEEIQSSGAIYDEANSVDLSFNSNFLLNEEQQEVASQILATSNQYTVSVIDGVTGSGKTEVYLKVAQEIMELGGQVLVLVPEIVLTTQLAERFKMRLGISNLAEWHSNANSSSKSKIWYSLQIGKINFIVGARSALFLPFSNLRLIIVDEEHDNSFKQEEGVIYNARDMAILRAKLEDIPIILASATPSIDTILSAKKAKFNYYTLENRYSGVVLPKIELVDLNKTNKKEDLTLSKTDNLNNQKKSAKKVDNNLHDYTRDQIINFYNNGKQSLLFINRRGYAPIIFCNSCSEKVKCPNCQFWLVYHKAKNIAQCHYCSYNIPYNSRCNNCDKENTIVNYGAGVERIAEEVSTFLPQARLLTVTSDTMSTYSKAQKAIQSITEGKVDIIIGTQIIAKGLHFSNLQLVVILGGDISNVGGDIRSLERTYQLLYQVIGRAGREKERGTVLVQTHEPLNPLLKCLVNGKKQDFTDLELQYRKEANMPPFTRLAIIHFTSSNEGKLIEYAEMIAKFAPDMSDKLIVWGPSPSPLTILNKKFRYRFIVKAEKNINLQKIIKNWISVCPIPNSVKVKIDIDPYNFS